MKKKLNIAYFSGGADFTLGPFFSLLKSNHNIKIVYSKAPKPSGRGKNIKNNVLINEAKKNNILTKSIDIFECNKDIKVLKSLDLDYIIVFSFGLILPKILLDIPKKGCLNIHTSLLPKWRGASPIQNSLINNEKETGFTFIMMNEKLDEGDIILKKKNQDRR